VAGFRVVLLLVLTSMDWPRFPGITHPSRITDPTKKITLPALPLCCLQVNIYLCLLDVASGMQYLHDQGVMHSGEHDATLCDWCQLFCCQEPQPALAAANVMLSLQGVET
jgi:hypothetical protein